MDAASQPQPAPRRAVALTRWRRAAHGAMHAALGLVCAVGAFASTLVGTEVYRGVVLVERQQAGSPAWAVWLLVIVAVGCVAFVGPRRATSRRVTAALV